MLFYGPVAQLVRAPPCHGGGRRFESVPGRFFQEVVSVLIETASFLLNILLKEEIVNYNICGLIRKTFKIKMNYIYNNYKQSIYSYCNEILANK